MGWDGECYSLFLSALTSSLLVHFVTILSEDVVAKSNCLIYWASKAVHLACWSSQGSGLLFYFLPERTHWLLDISTLSQLSAAMNSHYF